MRMEVKSDNERIHELLQGAELADRQTSQCGDPVGGLMQLL